jgi:hypothetical protein
MLLIHWSLVGAKAAPWEGRRGWGSFFPLICFVMDGDVRKRLIQNRILKYILVKYSFWFLLKLFPLLSTATRL